MQSSFEGELGSGVGPSFSLPPGVLGPSDGPPVAPSLPPTTLHGLTSIQEYNLQQLASLAEKEAASSPVVGVSPSQPTPSSNPSPTPSFTLADLFSGDISSTSNALNNLQALAKLGSVSLNNQGKLLVPLQDPATVNIVSVIGRTGVNIIIHPNRQADDTLYCRKVK
jgi:hypothetical protein